MFSRQVNLISFAVMSEDNNSPVTGHYFPPQLYYPTTNDEIPMPVIPPVRDTETQRKRPKYTRSKTGCMTCRVKKVKCDESKPICMRCTHGARECSWPEAIPTRKITSSKRGSVDERPSTSESVAESSGLSESLSSSGKEQTPPFRSLVDFVPVSPRLSDSEYEGAYSTSPDYNARLNYPQPHSHSFPITSASQYTARDHAHLSLDSQTVSYGIGSATSIRQQPLPQANHIYWNFGLDTHYYTHRVSLQENISAGVPGQSSSPLDYPHRIYQ